MKAVIFDFDGVIHNTFENGYGINVKIFGPDFTREEYKSFFDGNIHDSPKVTKENSEEFFRLHDELARAVNIDDGVVRSLKKLAEKYPLFIVSSNKSDILNHCLCNNNLDGVFEEILGADFHASKVEKFKFLFDKYGWCSNDCVFITDTLGDILEANNVDLRSIAVDFGFHERDRLEKGNPFRIVSSFDEILEIVNGLNG